MTPVHLGRVKELRAAKGWTQKQLATAANIRPATLNALEKGQTKGIDFDTLERLAVALGVAAGYLIVHDETEKSKRAKGK